MITFQILIKEKLQNASLNDNLSKGLSNNNLSKGLSNNNLSKGLSNNNLSKFLFKNNFSFLDLQDWNRPRATEGGSREQSQMFVLPKNFSAKVWN